MADHEDYYPGEAPMAHHDSHEDGGTDEISLAGLSGEPAELAAHSALATVHQDAPALILTHKGDPSAHHSKYTDAEARVLHSPISFAPCDFRPYIDTQDHLIYVADCYNRASLAEQSFLAPVHLPDGVTLTKFTLYGYKNLAGATLAIFFRRVTRVGTYTTIGTCIAGWTTGFSSISDSSISTPVVDNETYSYVLNAIINPVAVVTEVRLTGATVEFSG